MREQDIKKYVIFRVKPHGFINGVLPSLLRRCGFARYSHNSCTTRALLFLITQKRVLILCRKMLIKTILFLYIRSSCLHTQPSRFCSQLRTASYILGRVSL